MTRPKDALGAASQKSGMTDGYAWYPPAMAEEDEEDNDAFETDDDTPANAEEDN